MITFHSIKIITTNANYTIEPTIHRQRPAMYGAMMRCVLLPQVLPLQNALCICTDRANGKNILNVIHIHTDNVKDILNLFYDVYLMAKHPTIKNKIRKIQKKLGILRKTAENIEVANKRQ